MRGKLVLVLVGLLLVAGLTVPARGETVMIVHPDLKIDNVTTAEAANFFLAKATQWPGGQKAIPVDQKKAGVPGQAFLEKVVKMSESEFKNYWMGKMLSGEAEPLRVVESDADVVAFVKSTPGAVGYIAADSKAEGVKVVTVDGNKTW